MSCEVIPTDLGSQVINDFGNSSSVCGGGWSSQGAVRIGYLVPGGFQGWESEARG